MQPTNKNSISTASRLMFHTCLLAPIFQQLVGLTLMIDAVVKRRKVLIEMQLHVPKALANKAKNLLDPEGDILQNKIKILNQEIIRGALIATPVIGTLYIAYRICVIIHRKINHCLEEEDCSDDYLALDDPPSL